VEALPGEWSDTALKQYLLGLLPEGEAEALEDAYLGDPEVWERLRGVEEDLLDDYAARRLAPAERAVIESRYRASSPLRERLVAARALREAMEAGPRTTPDVAAVAARWGLPLTLAAGLILAALVLWPKRPGPSVVSSVTSPSPPVRSEPSTPPPTEPQTPPGRASTRPGRQPATTPFVLALSPGLLRGEERSAAVVPAGTDEVLFELEGDRSLLAPSGSVFPVVVETVEGRSMWRGEARRAPKTARPTLLATARVPTSRLEPGDYLLALHSGSADGTALYRYFFRLER
jgi:hypothetical protein